MTTTSVAAHVILRGGSLYEPGATAPQRADLAIAGGTVIGVGDVSSTADAHTEIIDVAGRLVLPGFTDAHIHPGAAQLEDLQCDLVGGTDAAGYLATIRGYADAKRDVDWLTGGGWAEEHFPGDSPQPGQLDTATGPRPTYLLNRDHHSAWVNTAALAAAGVTDSTVDPSDGRIGRGDAGRLTGVLYEGAMDLVSRVLPRPGPDLLRYALLGAQIRLHA